MSKGEIACIEQFEQFLLLSLFFQKTSAAEQSESRRGKGLKTFSKNYGNSINKRPLLNKIDFIVAKEDCS